MRGYKTAQQVLNSRACRLTSHSLRRLIQRSAPSLTCSLSTKAPPTFLAKLRVTHSTRTHLQTFLEHQVCPHGNLWIT